MPENKVIIKSTLQVLLLCDIIKKESCSYSNQNKLEVWNMMDFDLYKRMLVAEKKPQLFRTLAKDYMVQVNRHGLTFSSASFNDILAGLENFDQAWDLAMFIEEPENISCPSKFRHFIFRRVLKLANDKDSCRAIVDRASTPKEIRGQAEKKLKLIKTFAMPSDE